MIDLDIILENLEMIDLYFIEITLLLNKTHVSSFSSAFLRYLYVKFHGNQLNRNVNKQKRKKKTEISTFNDVFIWFVSNRNISYLIIQLPC